ncbi:MAG: HD domain-containing protein [Patescibacteria group bacterium]
MTELDKILQFTDLLNRFRSVTRVVRIKGDDRMENDSEHSFQLAMLAWYIISSNKLENLNIDLILKYALVHDLVEVYAGDTFFYGSEQELGSKKDREAAAAARIAAEFPNFSDLHLLIHQYELRQDPESCFVYALDKVVPILNIYLDNGRTWKENNILLEELIRKKTDKVALSPEIQPYFEQIIQILTSEADKLFNKIN